MYNHYRTVAENSVKQMPPDGFFGIQVLQKPILAGPLPQIPLGKLTTFPRQLGKGIPPPFSTPPCSPSTLTLHTFGIERAQGPVAIAHFKACCHPWRAPR